VNGTIIASQTTTVTYSWSSGGGGTIQVGPGGVTVHGKVASGSPPWNGSDTLSVTSPVTESASINLSTTCSFLAVSASNSGSEGGSEDVAITPVTIFASGGNGSYQFSLSGPGWMSLSASGSSATVTGTPPATDGNCTSTNYNATVTVTDTEASPQSAQTSFSVRVSTRCIQ
jgi:hypothetical protein